MMPTMTTNTAPKQSTTSTFDRKEVSRVVSRIRHELTTLATDAERRNPLFSRSVDEAVAKRDASVKALLEFAEHIATVTDDH